MRRLAAILAALTGVLSLVSAASAVTTQAPEGELGIRLLEAPENRRDDPRARIYIVDHLKQGDTINRRMEVFNTTTAAADVSLYAAAASVQDGEFVFGEGRAQNDLTSWTTVDPAQVSVPAGGAVEAVVTVAVPTDAVDGERYGVVWAEVASSGAGSIAQVSRVGIRMYLSVGEGAEPPTDFVVDELTALRRDGRPLALATVTNTGQRALDMSGQLTLTDGPGGVSAGPFDASLGTTLGIGESHPVEIVLDPALPDGPWTARITLRSGQTERSVEGTVTFTAEAVTVPLQLTEDDDDRLLWPAVLAGLLALLALLAVVAVLLRRGVPGRRAAEPAGG